MKWRTTHPVFVLPRQPASDRPAIRRITTIRNGIANVNVAATFVDTLRLGGWDAAAVRLVCLAVE